MSYITKTLSKKKKTWISLLISLYILNKALVLLGNRFGVLEIKLRTLGSRQALSHSPELSWLFCLVLGVRQPLTCARQALHLQPLRLTSNIHLSSVVVVSVRIVIIS